MRKTIWIAAICAAVLLVVRGSFGAGSMTLGGEWELYQGERRVRQAKVVVENKAPAFGVMLSVKGVSGVVWEPNFVTLAPGEHTFMCALPDGVSAEDFTQNLKVEDLASARKGKETK